MKLSKRAETALRGSIKKWEKIAADKGEDLGGANCPLCKLYYVHDCLACPVRLHTDAEYCEDTPYIDWYDHHYDDHSNISGVDSLVIECSVCVSLAKAELNFLRSLLPEAEHDG